MTETRRVEVTLLGQTLALRTEATPEHVRALARYLEDRVATLQRSGVRDAMKALTLAALDITDELFRARDDRAREQGDVGDRMRVLVALLDRVTPRGEQSA
jgi:cell division protein ZapA (FtsZ GTPase activity inhibitor)